MGRAVIVLAVVAMIGVTLAGCRSNSTVQGATATPSATTTTSFFGPLATRAFATPDRFHWVGLQGEFVLGSDVVEQNRRMALGGVGVEFTNDPAPTVGPDEDIALVGVRSETGLPGVLLVRSDETSMAMYVFRDRSTTFGGVGFAPWVGMTLFGASDSSGQRIVAINNYARIQFQLDVQDHRGRIAVAPDLSYVALLREREIELVPLETPGQTTVVSQDARSPDGNDLPGGARRCVAVVMGCDALGQHIRRGV